MIGHFVILLLTYGLIQRKTEFGQGHIQTVKKNTSCHLLLSISP